MTMTRALMLVAALTLAPAGAGWAADTDVENPNLRELPLQRGPIMGGHKHQPTASEIQEREQERQQPRDPAAASSAPAMPVPAAPRAAAGQTDDLYQRVLQQSQHPTPRAIIPDQ
jgi:hypothetical protein